MKKICYECQEEYNTIIYLDIQVFNEEKLVKSFCSYTCIVTYYNKFMGLKNG